MTTKLLADFKGLCHYDVAEQKFIIDSEVSGNQQWLTATQSATIGAGGDPEGVEFSVKVYHADADFESGTNDDWERMTATYSLDGSEVSFTRVATQASTTGGAITSFSTTESSLVIMGVASPERLDDIESRVVLQETKPMASAYLTSNMGLLAGAAKQLTGVTVTIDTKSALVGGTYTVPVGWGGCYRVSGMNTFQVAADGDRIRSLVKIGGSVKANPYYVAKGGSFQSAPFNKVFNLSVGDTISVWAENADSADTVTALDAYTYFDIVYEGP